MRSRRRSMMRRSCAEPRNFAPTMEPSGTRANYIKPKAGSATRSSSMTRVVGNTSLSPERNCSARLVWLRAVQMMPISARSVGSHYPPPPIQSCLNFWLALDGFDEFRAGIGLPKKSATFDEQRGHPVCQSPAGRIDDAHVGTKLDDATRQFQPVEAICRVRHVDVCEKQGDGRASFQKGKCLSGICRRKGGVAKFCDDRLCERADSRLVFCDEHGRRRGFLFPCPCHPRTVPERSTARIEVRLPLHHQRSRDGGVAIARLTRRCEQISFRASRQ